MRRALGLCLGGIFIVTSAATAQAPPPQPVQAVVKHLVGVMDTGLQATVNPQKSHVRMTTCRVTLTSAPPDIVYLYQEQALAVSLTKPYRQRILEISASPYSQTVRSRSFKLSHPVALIGWCQQPEAQRKLVAQDLDVAVCSVFLRQSGDEFAGSTPIDGCPANIRGAVRITNRIRLHAHGMETWDRGFDAQGNQVWGAQTEAYQYRWVKTP
jgi:CpeT/CpcT family (DUF1001)